MAAISVNMNTKEAIAKIRSYGMAARGRLKDHVSITALNVERGAKKFCAVDTGRLRSSIHLMNQTFDGLGAEVGTEVHYAPHVEYGTVNQRAQPFMIPAAAMSRNEWLKGIKEIMKNVK